MLTIYRYVHWIVPTLAGLLLSASLMLVFVAFVNYMIQTYGQYAASIIAVNTFARTAGSAAAPLFTNSMFNALGVGGGGSLLGGCAALLALIPFVFYKYGERLRTQSKYTEDNATKIQASGAGEEYPTGYDIGPETTRYSTHGETREPVTESDSQPPLSNATEKLSTQDTA